MAALLISPSGFSPRASNANTLVDDPISDTTKARICAFVESYLLAEPTKGDKEAINKRMTIFDNHFLQGCFDIVRRSPSCYYMLTEGARDCLRDIARINAHETAGFRKAKEIMNDVYRTTTKSFEVFRSILCNPALMATAFQIDPTHYSQVFSARKFMQVAITSIHEPDQIQSMYVRIMNQSSLMPKDAPKSISLRNRLIMQNDPIQKLDRSKVCQVQDLILARTFFVTPTADKNDGTVLSANREEARKAIKAIIINLCESPEPCRYPQIP